MAAFNQRVAFRHAHSPRVSGRRVSRCVWLAVNCRKSGDRVLQRLRRPRKLGARQRARRTAPNRKTGDKRTVPIDDRRQPVVGARLTLQQLAEPTERENHRQFVTLLAIDVDWRLDRCVGFIHGSGQIDVGQESGALVESASNKV